MKPSSPKAPTAASLPDPTDRGAPPTAEILPVSLDNPDPAVVQRAADALAAGGLIAFPTDTLYALGAVLGNADAVDRLKRLRRIDTSKRPFTLMLPDVGTLPHYAKVSESAYRIVNKIFPGPYCVELPVGPKMMGKPGFTDRETLGLRIPGCALCSKLLWKLGRPVVSVTAKGPSDAGADGTPLTTAEQIAETYGNDLALILDGGEQAGLPSTVISLVDDWVTVLRAGRGSTDNLR
jgi:tRNA threonylcarbamoyl adenosine modification protein (Sua5/YciO/YrdC/YwlC family)